MFIKEWGEAQHEAQDACSRWSKSCYDPDPMSDSIPTSSDDPEILLVDDVPLLLQSLGRLLHGQYRLAYANSGEEALEILERWPAIEVIVSDFDMPGMKGTELLTQVVKTHPLTSRILLTGVPKFDLAREAFEQAKLHRFLCKPCGSKELLEALSSGVKAHYKAVREELEACDLLFSTESLAVQNRDLEQRIDHQAQSIYCLRQMGIDLNQARGLEEIADVATLAASQALDGRGVSLQFRNLDEALINFSAGPEISARMLSEPLVTQDGIIGEFVVDVLNPNGRRMGSAQQNILASIASSTAVAIHNELRHGKRHVAQ
ncbi:MAG: CheY-like chemotaxis protein [Planctomycetota bacterium]